MSARLALAVAAMLTLLVIAPPEARTTPRTLVSASCHGHASVHIAGQTGAASASGACRGRPIGRSTFRASARARVTEPSCATYRGRGEISTRHGTLRLTGLPNARACTSAQADVSSVSFSGRARIVGGTGRFRRARGTIAYSGHYDRSSGKIAISLHGRLTG